MNETMKTILNRRSIRAYTGEQIQEEQLQDILKAGIYAPSAMNQESWHFTVVQNKDILNRINEACKEVFRKSGNKAFEERANKEGFSVFYNAPTLIIVSGDEKAIATQLDCAIALENMFLAAESMNIGSCWIHAISQLFQAEEGKALLADLSIPEGYKPLFSGAFGYKAAGSPEPPARKENAYSIIR